MRRARKKNKGSLMPAASARQSVAVLSMMLIVLFGFSTVSALGEFDSYFETSDTSAFRQDGGLNLYTRYLPRPCGECVKTSLGPNVCVCSLNGLQTCGCPAPPPGPTCKPNGNWCFDGTCCSGICEDRGGYPTCVAERSPPPVQSLTTRINVWSSLNVPYNNQGRAPLTVLVDSMCTDPDNAHGNAQDYSNIKSCILDFGDGSPMFTATDRSLSLGSGIRYPVIFSTPSMQHTYSSPGTYTLRVTGTNSQNAVTQSEVTITVLPENAPPNPVLYVSQSSGTAPFTAYFSNTCQDPDGSTLSSCTINYGDGTGTFQITKGYDPKTGSYYDIYQPDIPYQPNTPTANSNLISSTSSTHTYLSKDTVMAGQTSPGAQYTVTLTATDNKGASNSSSVTVTVRPNQNPTATLSVKYPAFNGAGTIGSVSLTEGFAPFNVTFLPSCSDPDGTIASCVLEFGDGSTADAKPASTNTIGGGGGRGGCYNPCKGGRGRACPAVCYTPPKGAPERSGAGVVSGVSISILEFTHKYEKTGILTAKVIATDNSGAVTESAPVTITSKAPLIGKIEKISVNPESRVRGVKNTITINFTTSDPMPGTGRIVINMPMGYDLSRASTGYCNVGGPLQFNALSASANQATFTARGLDFQVPAGDMTCVIRGVRNPAYVGTTGTTTVLTTDSERRAIDTGTGSDSLLTGSGTLSGVTAYRSNTRPGERTNLTISFTTVNPIPGDGAITVTLPSGFSQSGLSVSCPTIGDPATSPIRISSYELSTKSGFPTVFIRLGSTTEPPGKETCVIQNLVNPSTLSNDAYIYQVSTTDELQTTTTTTTLR